MEPLRRAFAPLLAIALALPALAADAPHRVHEVVRLSATLYELRDHEAG